MHMPKNTFSKLNFEIAIFTRFYLTMGHLRLTIGYLRAIVVNIRVTLGHLRVTIGNRPPPTISLILLN